MGLMVFQLMSRFKLCPTAFRIPLISKFDVRERLQLRVLSMLSQHPTFPPVFTVEQLIVSAVSMIPRVPGKVDLARLVGINADGMWRRPQHRFEDWDQSGFPLHLDRVEGIEIQFVLTQFRCLFAHQNPEFPTSRHQTRTQIYRVAEHRIPGTYF